MTYKKFRIRNKNRELNYIRFDLDDYIEFINGKHSFVFCPNEYPFINYQVGDEIEVDLVNSSQVSSQSYHQGILRKVSRSYVHDYNDYSLPQVEAEPSSEKPRFPQPLELTSAQKQKTLHQVKLALDSFYNVLEPLEEFIDKAGYYPNFRSKRQLYRRVIQNSEGTLENNKNLLLTDLYIFSGAVEGETGFIMEVLKEDFYRWINYTGITAENCPERLKHFLIEINNVLEGNDEKIVQETDERDRVRAKKPDLKEVINIFSGLQQPLNRNRDQRKELGNQSWSELDDKDRLKGNVDLGRKTFEQIKRSISISHQSFKLWQKLGEEEIINVMEGIESSSSYQAVQEQPTQLPQGRWAWVNGGWLWIPS